MSLKIYDSKAVSMIFAGILVDGGYDEDEFLTIEQSENDFVTVIGADGEVTRSKTNNGHAVIKVKLMQSSGANPALSALNNLDKLAGNGAGVGPMLIRDQQGTSIYTAAKCWIAKPPDVAFGKTAKPREWTFECENLIRLDGGN